jgi:hypothetical protein
LSSGRPSRWVGAAFAGKLGGLITSDTGSYVPSSAESTKALEAEHPGVP